jgi:5-methylcytosine-specific restriction protein A
MAASAWVHMGVVAEMYGCTEFQLRVKLMARQATTLWRSRPYERRRVAGQWYMLRSDVRRALKRTPPRRRHMSESMRHEILRRDSWQCQMCRCVLNVRTAEIDHRVALYRGGADTIENCQALCSNCHRQKTHDERREARDEQRATRASKFDQRQQTSAAFPTPA